jgi:hypothetical protein
MAYRFISLTLALLFLPLLLNAQSQRGEYLKIDYLNVTAEQMQNFDENVIDQIKEYKNERLANGDIDSWILYRVLFSGSASTNYNYVSITSTSMLDAFDAFNNNFQNAMGEMSEDNQFDISKSELWTVRNTMTDVISEEPSHFLMMDYMHVKLGRELEYQMLEDEIAKPLHETRLENDRMDDWEMYQLITPGGTDYGYNFATGNYFTNLSHIEFGFNEELIRTQNPEVDVMEFFEQIWSTRDLVKSELWQRREYSVPGMQPN